MPKNLNTRPGLEPLIEGGGAPGGYSSPAISGGRSLFERLKDKAEVFMRPKVENSVYPDLFSTSQAGQYAVRNVRGPEEIEAIRQSGYMLPKEGGKSKKYFTQTDNMRTESNAMGDNSVLRVPIEKVPSNRAVSRKDVEKFNPETGMFEPLMNGGVVGKATGGQPSGPPPDIAAKLAQLREEFAIKAEMERRRQQGILNMEKVAGPVKLLTDKAKGGSVHPIGINVASDLKADRSYADLIVDGHKTYESRNGDTLRPYVGKRVAIVRTGEGPAKAIGEVTIGEPEVVNRKRFRELENHHFVPEGSKFDINTETKHLYPLHKAERYEQERDVGHGIIARKVIHEAKGGSVEPKKTVKAYKLFRVHPKHPGKLFPLFVNANEPVEMGKWQDAQIGEMTGNKVKSKIGPLAFRPGWHAGDVPVATHIGEKSDPDLTAPDVRPDNHVWAEVEMPHDVDWQSEANKRGTNAQGRVVPVKAHITDQIPKGGHYRYKTNSNMTGNWLIGGSMKVNRVLDDKEVRSINKAAGVADLPRTKPFNAKKYGFAGGGTVAPDEWKAEEHVNCARGGSTSTIDDDLLTNLEEPPSMRDQFMDNVMPAVNKGFDAAFPARRALRSIVQGSVVKPIESTIFSSPVDYMENRNIAQKDVNIGLRHIKNAMREKLGTEKEPPLELDYGDLKENSFSKKPKYPKLSQPKAHGGITHAHHLEIEERPL